VQACEAARIEILLDNRWDNGAGMATPITSSNARKKLEARGKPYFKRIGAGLYLGYRKNEAGGKWVARRYRGGRTKDADGGWTAGRHESETIGIADDNGRKADGVEILTYDQAASKARKWAKQPAKAEDGTHTIAEAIAEYLVERESREGAASVGMKRDARSRLNKHVTQDLANKSLAELSENDLSAWRESLTLKLSDGAVRRTANDLKAALNRAARRHRESLPASISNTIKDGLAVSTPVAAVAREAQVLPDGDVRRIISAAWDIDEDGKWQGDLARLVLVLAATGARFSQISRVTVGDLQPEQKRLMVPVSRKGRGTKNISRIGVRVGDDVLDALRQSVAGRKGPDPLLLRPRWKQISLKKWAQTGRAPWLSASELLRPWALILARAGLPADVVPYALRHSSIVRGLRAGLPVRLVAALHDTSSAMIEKHYAAYIVDALDELAARAVVPLVQKSTSVVALRGSADADVPRETNARRQDAS
jgi:integrase